MLGADGDLDGLGRQIDALVREARDGAGVHLAQALEGGGAGGAAARQVVARLRAEAHGIPAAGVAAEVEEDAAPADGGLAPDEQVDQRGAAREGAVRVEGPLVALEEEPVGRGGVRAEGLRQEGRGRATGGRADQARHRLQVGARDVPARPERREAVLRFGQVAREGARLERQADGAGVPLGIDAVAVEAARPPDGQQGVLGEVDFGTARVVEGQEAGAAARSAGSRVRQGQQRDGDAALVDWQAQAPQLGGQCAAHVAARVGAGRGGALPRVVVGLVADELAVAVARKGHAEVDEVEEGARRAGGLGQREVAVHGAAGREVGGHRARRVGCRAAEPELVVGLLVAASVDGGAGREALGDDEHVVQPAAPRLERRVQAGCAAARHQRVAEVEGHRAPGRGREGGGAHGGDATGAGWRGRRPGG